MNNTFKLNQAVTAFLVFAVLSVFGCSDQPEPPPPSKTFETVLRAKVTVIEGPDPEEGDLTEIDKQITRIKQIGEGQGYTAWPGHSRYVIELVDPDPGSCQAFGSFLTNAGQYGGETICVAGRYYPGTDRIRTTLGALRTSKVVQYEAEHFGLKYNDEQKYEDTLTHVPCPPKCHPIFGIE